MKSETAGPIRAERRIDAAIKHLESVAAVCRQKSNHYKVIPFPLSRSQLYESSN